MSKQDSLFVMWEMAKMPLSWFLIHGKAADGMTLCYTHRVAIDTYAIRATHYADI